MIYPRNYEEAKSQQIKVNVEAEAATERLAKEVLEAKSFETVAKVWEDFHAAANSYYDYAIWYPDGENGDSSHSQFDDPMDLMNRWPWGEVPTFGPKPELRDADDALSWNSHKILVHLDYDHEPNEYEVLTFEEYRKRISS